MTDLDLFTQEPYAGHAGYQRGSKTSVLAAQKVTRDLNRWQELVLLAYQVHGEMTPDECAMRMGEDVLRVRPRCTELVLKKKLRKVGRQRPSKMGNPQEVLDVNNFEQEAM